MTAVGDPTGSASRGPADGSASAGPPDGLASVGGPAGSAAEIAAGIDDMYDAFLAGDRVRFDAHLHPRVTTWETHLPGPLRERSELDEYRTRRDAAGARPALTVLAARDKRIDVWADTGLARYLLVAAPAGDGPATQSRVTDVLRRTEAGWLIVHHHAELLAGSTDEPPAAARRADESPASGRRADGPLASRQRADEPGVEPCAG
jgi:hypothetical protein